MTIKTIRMLRDERGLTVRKIAKYLNDNAIPTRHSYRLGWNFQVVAKILARGDSDLADEREHPRPQQEAG